MKRRKFIAILIPVFSLTISPPENLSLRRIHQIKSRPESILFPRLIPSPSVSLLQILTARLPGISGILQLTTSEYSESTWKIGTMLAILKDIQGLKLEDLDIVKWIKDNYQYLSQLEDFQGLEIPSSSEPFEQLVSRYKTISHESYQGIKHAIINYYFLEFIQKFFPSELDLLNRPREIRHDIIFKMILNLPQLRDTAPEIDITSLVIKGYLPDLWTLGELKFSAPQDYNREIEDYLLNKLIKSELEGYARRWLCSTKYSRQLAEIKTQLFYSNDITEIKKEIRRHYTSLDVPDQIVERLLAGDNLELFRNLLAEIRITRLIQKDINIFIQQNYPVLRRAIWSAFNFKPYFGNNDILVNLLTISEAEYLVRKIIRIYFNQMISDIMSVRDKRDFDPHLDANKNKNRLAYEDWRNVLNKIEEIKHSFRTLPSFSYRVNRTVTYFLLKKLATAGVYDLSLKDIKDRFIQSGFLMGLEETENMREYRFEISSFNKLFKEVFYNKEQRIKLIITADNHGEIIYLLGLIQYLLRMNPNLTIYLIPRANPVADDVYATALWDILRYDHERYGYFDFLYYQIRSPTSERRFYIVKNGPEIQGEDFRIISNSEYYALTSQTNARREKFDKIIYFGIGNANFVSTQGLKIERYYLFRVKTDRVAEATGISKEGYPLILTYLEPEACIGTSFGTIKKYASLLQYIKFHPEFFDPPLGNYH